MSLLHSVKGYFRKRSLEKLAKQPTSASGMSMEAASSVGIIFDATEAGSRKQALQYAEQLRKAGKRIHLLAFFNSKEPAAEFSFDYYNLKDIDWAGRPKGNKVDYFLQQKFDIFVLLNPISTIHFDYLAALTAAPLKVGPVTKDVSLFNLMIDVQKKDDLSSFIKQLVLLLKKTNIRHEAAKI